MKNNIPEQVVWILVGALAVATILLTVNYQKMNLSPALTAPPSQQNTANVIGVGLRNCASAIVPLLQLCMTYKPHLGGEFDCCIAQAGYIFNWCQYGDGSPQYNSALAHLQQACGY